MKVYRVVYPADHPANEKNVPCGPYNCGNSQASEESTYLLRRLMMEHCNNEHPSPFTDHGLYGISPSEYCCFASEEQMAEWFYSFGYDLTAAGCVIMVMEVDASHVRKGVKQAVVAQDHAKVVSVEPCLAFIE